MGRAGLLCYTTGTDGFLGRVIIHSQHPLEGGGAGGRPEGEDTPRQKGIRGQLNKVPSIDDLLTLKAVRCRKIPDHIAGAIVQNVDSQVGRGVVQLLHEGPAVGQQRRGLVAHRQEDIDRRQVTLRSSPTNNAVVQRRLEVLAPYRHTAI